MFGRPKIDLTQLQPTSKMSLKLTCLAACGNDVRAASELYNFIAGDLTLPDIDPEEPSAFAKFRQSADDIFGWVGEHKEDLLQGWQMIRSLRSSGAVQTSGVPPIPNEL